MYKAKTLNQPNRKFFQSGIAGILLIFIILLLLIGILVGFDFGYIAYQENQNVFPTPTISLEQKQTPVVAQGTFSKGKYSVNLILRFALEGGSVSGEFSGDCSGSISGQYDGGDNGQITGKAVGSCSPFLVPIPASATFSGTVSHQQKVVPVSGTGSAAGFSGSGSSVLTF